MRQPADFPSTFDVANVNELAPEQPTIDRLLAELDTSGVVVLPKILPTEQLRGMQDAFAAKLHRLRWNNFDGYQKTEQYRHMVEDVLLLHQGFVDIALNPLIRQILNRYLGVYELTEAKGWESRPTRRDFHGWHGDAWYDQDSAQEIPREVKLAFYLSDVHSGAFNYIKGSHRKQHPRPVRNNEVENVPASQIAALTGPAGTAFLFDTSGIHRQGVPMLERRRAVFYNYHDPSVRLQKEDIDHYRYHPLLLNAALLGNLSGEDQRILGFGNQTNYQPAFEREPRHTMLQDVFRGALEIAIRAGAFRERVAARLKVMKPRAK